MRALLMFLDSHLRHLFHSLTITAVRFLFKSDASLVQHLCLAPSFSHEAGNHNCCSNMFWWSKNVSSFGWFVGQNEPRPLFVPATFATTLHRLHGSYFETTTSYVLQIKDKMTSVILANLILVLLQAASFTVAAQIWEACHLFPF